ncbi:Transcriptional regulator [Burkholderia sp. IT-111MI5]
MHVPQVADDGRDVRMSVAFLDRSCALARLPKQASRMRIHAARLAAVTDERLAAVNGVRHRR